MKPVVGGARRRSCKFLHPETVPHCAGPKGMSPREKNTNRRFHLLSTLLPVRERLLFDLDDGLIFGKPSTIGVIKMADNAFRLDSFIEIAPDILLGNSPRGRSMNPGKIQGHRTATLVGRVEGYHNLN